MQVFSKGKQLISDVEFVTCPYCKELNENKKQILDGKHLKKHGKSLDDVRMEFPHHVTMTYIQHQARVNRGRALKSRLKKVKCFYSNDPDCPGDEYEVPGTSPNFVICDHCTSVGKENPDGRTKEHANAAREATLQKKHGRSITNVAHIHSVVEKRTATNIERYGGIGFASEELLNKTRSTMEQKFGVKNFMQCDIGKEHFRGDKNPMKRKEISSKVSKSLKGRQSHLKGKKYDAIFNIEKANQLKEEKRKIFRERFVENEFRKLLDYFGFDFIDNEYLGAHIFHNFKCKKCGTIMNKQWNSIQQNFKCEICYPRNNGTSIAEQEILKFVKEILPGEEVYKTRKVIAPKELDIFIPSKMIAIEHNGLWHHSEDHVAFSGPTSHIDKTIACQKLGIRLIQIFEDEWALKKDICKSRLKQILGISKNKRIHARKCEIREIDSAVKNDFLNKYHIQGSDLSSIKLGAFYKNKLVSVMTFSKGNPAKGVKERKESTWELNRFCNNNNYHIPGVAGKLLSHFKSNYEWNEIYSYADRRWSTGNLYQKLNFEQVANTALNYWYVKGLKRIHRFALRKKPDEPKDITEKTLRLLEGYIIVWDCGNLKFSIKK